jgi:SNF2 family DNA or RNA helicase
MKDSIEERMIALQEAKAAIGKGAMEKLKPEEIRKTRIGDLKSLFSIKEETA